MVDGEGSVITDGQDAEDSQNENSEESENSANINNSDNDTGSQEGQSGETDTSSDIKPDEGGKVKLTEKGTKLAENPLQQANQLRANAEAKAKQYEEFFSKPENVEAFLKDLRGGVTPTNQPASGADKVSEMTDAEVLKLAEGVQNTGDVVNVLKGIIALTRGEIQKVRQEFQGFTTGAKVKETNANVASEIQQVQSKYPVLQKTLPDGSENPEFDKDLDDTIGRLFLKMDFDPATKTFRGKTSLMEVTDMVMKAAKISESRGSRKAQTVIKDRRSGRVISGGANTDNSKVDESSMSPSQAIANRISRISKKR
jgi:hypothetical protein